MTTPLPPNPLLEAFPGAGRTDPTGPALYASTERILGRTRATQLKLKPRIALVVRAMAGAGHDVDGGIAAELLATPLSPKSALVVEVLVTGFTRDQILAQLVGRAVERFRRTIGTVRAVEVALETGTLESALVQELKLAAFFLSRFHEAMREDVVLAELFPPPQVLQADAGHAEMRELTGPSPMLQRARRLLADLQPATTAARVALGVLRGGEDPEGTVMLRHTADWSARHAELLGPLSGFLEETVRSYDRLAAAVLQGEVDESWPRLMNSLGQSMDDLQRNPVLRGLIRANGPD